MELEPANELEREQPTNGSQNESNREANENNSDREGNEVTGEDDNGEENNSESNGTTNDSNNNENDNTANVDRNEMRMNNNGERGEVGEEEKEEDGDDDEDENNRNENTIESSDKNNDKAGDVTGNDAGDREEERVDINDDDDDGVENGTGITNENNGDGEANDDALAGNTLDRESDGGDRDNNKKKIINNMVNGQSSNSNNNNNNNDNSINGVGDDRKNQTITNSHANFYPTQQRTLYDYGRKGYQSPSAANNGLSSSSLSSGMMKNQNRLLGPAQKRSLFRSRQQSTASFGPTLFSSRMTTLLPDIEQTTTTTMINEIEPTSTPTASPSLIPTTINDDDNDDAERDGGEEQIDKEETLTTLSSLSISTEPPEMIINDNNNDNFERKDDRSRNENNVANDVDDLTEFQIDNQNDNNDDVNDAHDDRDLRNINNDLETTTELDPELRRQLIRNRKQQRVGKWLDSETFETVNDDTDDNHRFNSFARSANQIDQGIKDLHHRNVQQERPLNHPTSTSSLTNGHQSTQRITRQNVPLSSSPPSPNINDDESLAQLSRTLQGVPGQDYPIFGEIPRTKFNCRDHKWPGFYADIEAQCQVN